jgi:indolepyruvate decarboxylase
MSVSTQDRRADSARRTTANLSIGDYLIQRLQDYGIHDVFGIPGDYVLSFYSMMEASPINVVGCTREDCAGFAADGYARLTGMGAVCITYCVGGLSVCNSVAGAFAEKSPVVVISGSPGLNERQNNPLLHHKVRDFRTQLEVFEKFTIAATEITDPMTAFSEIDRVLDAADRFKRPVYIELPRDMVHVVPPVTHGYRGTTWERDPEATEEGVAEAVARINAAERPVIVAGVELHRFGLHEELLALAEATSIPIAATMLGKSVVSERHPLYLGLYEGALGNPDVAEFVESSDLVMLLGTFLTDINLGVYTAKLDLQRCIYVTSEQMQISHHHYHNVPLDGFLRTLASEPLRRTERKIPEVIAKRRMHGSFERRDDEPLRISRMMGEIEQRLDNNTIVIADVGDSLFAATELITHDRGEFLSPAYYTSMGFSTPAAVGAAYARPDRRILILAGDGAFQMTGQELSTLTRHGHSPILVIFDNHGYGTERYLHEGEWQYNEINPWAYHKLPEIYCGGTGYLVTNEAEFAAALDASWDDRSGPHVIHAKLEEDDASQTLRNLAERLGQRVGSADKS